MIMQPFPIAIRFTDDRPGQEGVIVGWTAAEDTDDELGPWPYVLTADGSGVVLVDPLKIERAHAGHSPITIESEHAGTPPRLADQTEA